MSLCLCVCVRGRRCDIVLRVYRKEHRMYMHIASMSLQALCVRRRACTHLGGTFSQILMFFMQYAHVYVECIHTHTHAHTHTHTHTRTHTHTHTHIHTQAFPSKGMRTSQGKPPRTYAYIICMCYTCVMPITCMQISDSRRMRLHASQGEPHTCLWVLIHEIVGLLRARLDRN